MGVLCQPFFPSIGHLCQGHPITDGAFVHTATITTFPIGFVGRFKNRAVLNGFDQFVVAPFMPLLDLSNPVKYISNLLKALLSGDIGKTDVQGGPL
jgi:hypothetical protein